MTPGRLSEPIQVGPWALATGISRLSVEFYCLLFSLNDQSHWRFSELNCSKKEGGEAQRREVPAAPSQNGTPSSGPALRVAPLHVPQGQPPGRGRKTAAPAWLGSQNGLFSCPVLAADAFFKAAIGLVPEVPKMINIDGKMRPSESFLLEFLCNFFSTLLIVPVRLPRRAVGPGFLGPTVCHTSPPSAGVSWVSVLW